MIILQYSMTESANHNSFGSDPTDQTLMRRFCSGQQDAASALYIRYAKRLEQLASRQTSTELSFRITSEEIVQSVFRTFFRRVAKGQYQAVDGDDLWRLLLVISLNKIRSAADYHQSQKRDIRKTRSTDPEILESYINLKQQDEIALSVLKLTIDELLQQLPTNHAEIVRLRIAGSSLPEISQAIGRSQRTAERVLQSFREVLIKIIEE